MMIGFTRNVLVKIANQLTEKNDLKHCFNNEKESASIQWYRCFMQRHHELSFRQAETTSVARAKGFNRKNVGYLYNKLETLIEKHGLDAKSIYNMDESSITTVQKPGRVVGKRGQT